jgi:hypothetical protein
MVGALVATVLVVLAFVAFRAFNRTDVDVRPAKVDYLAQVRDAQQAGSQVIYPASLPAGWYATQVTLSPGTPSQLQLSMLTGDALYAGYIESPQSASELLTTYVDPHAQPGAPVTVSGSAVSRWQAWTDSGGDTALVAQTGHGASRETLLLFGTVSRGQLEQVAGSLTTKKVASG